MKNQKLKIKNEDTLKGTGFASLGWTEGGKMNSTVKRLLASFKDKEVSSDSKNKNKIIVQCSECHRKFKTSNGKLPEHQNKLGWLHRIGEIGAPSRIICEGVLQVENENKTKLKKIIINNVTFKIGDKVLYEKLVKGSKMCGIKDTTKLSEGVIDSIIVNQTGTLIYFDEGQNGFDYIKLDEYTEIIKL